MSDEAQPIPPRFRWLKRGAIAAAVGVVGLVALRWYWGHAMQARVDAQLAAVAARGEPTTLAELNPPPIPDSENAAVYYRRALADWPRIDGMLVIEHAWHSKPDEHPDPVQDDQAYLDQCQAVFELLEKGAEASGCDWGVRLQAGNLPHLSHLGQMRGLGRLIEDASKRAHAIGDDALALALIEHLLTLAHAAEPSGQSLLLDHLVAISLRAMAIGCLETFMPTLSIGNAPGEATPEHIAELTARLLNDDVWRRGQGNAFVGEAVWGFESAMAVAQGRVTYNQAFGYGPMAGMPQWLINAAFGPQLARDALVVWQVNYAISVAARSTASASEFEATVRSRGVDVEAIEGRPLLHPLASILLPALAPATRTTFQGRIQARLAGVAIAIRHYECDHGRRPDTLDALVPAYLKAVPIDLYADDGRPIRYVPEGVVPQAPSGMSQGTSPAGQSRLAILYSIGRNGVDDGGLVFVKPTGELIDYERYQEEADHWFLLDPAPASVPETDGDPYN